MTAYPDITGTTRIAAVIGHPVAHSVSPQLHNEISRRLGADLAYIAADVEPERLGEAVQGMRALRFVGFNVTVPHKRDVIRHLDECDREAILVGAVNTVKNAGGRLIGYNTDIEGFARAFREETGRGFEGMRAIVFGAGGSARAIAVKLALDGAEAIEICGRDPARAAAIRDLVNGSVRAAASVLANDDAAKAAALARADLVVNASASGMRGIAPDEFGFADLPLRKGQFVYDIVYDPPETPLLARAKAAGCPSMNGLRMLFWQGIQAYGIWTGATLGKDLLDAVWPVFLEAAKAATGAAGSAAGS